MHNSDLHPESHACVRSFVRAAGLAAQQSSGQAHLKGLLLQDMIKEALSSRSSIMFSGASGDVVTSGIKGDAAALEKPDLFDASKGVPIIYKLAAGRARAGRTAASSRQLFASGNYLLELLPPRAIPYSAPA